VLLNVATWRLQPRRRIGRESVRLVFLGLWRLVWYGKLLSMEHSGMTPAQEMPSPGCQPGGVARAGRRGEVWNFSMYPCTQAIRSRSSANQFLLGVESASR